METYFHVEVVRQVLLLRKNHSGMETEKWFVKDLVYHCCVRTIVVWKLRQVLLYEH